MRISALYFFARPRSFSISGGPAGGSVRLPAGSPISSKNLSKPAGGEAEEHPGGTRVAGGEPVRDAAREKDEDARPAVEGLVAEGEGCLTLDDVEELVLAAVD